MHLTMSPTAHDRARSLLASWSAPDPGQHLLRQEYLEFLDAHPGALGRTERAGHLTASALIVDRDRVLLTLHPTVGRWLQTGGHIEDDDVDLGSAALREAREEGGITDLVLDPEPLRLDRHSVRCRSDAGDRTELDHLDVQFLAVAPPDAVARRSAESDDLRWWAWDALPADTDDSVRALVAQARIRRRVHRAP